MDYETYEGTAFPDCREECDMIFKQFIVGNMGVCCYVVACEESKEAAIIDPGGDEQMILQEVQKLGLTVKYIIATHGHPDHVCGNGPIQEVTGAKIIMHEKDAEFFSRPETENYFAMLGLPASPPVDICVQDGDIITVGTVKMQVIHTPGHTPGGICLYSAPNLITGDTLFVGGIGRTDFPGGSYEELMQSLKNRIFPLADETVIWPGHGYGGSQSTLISEKQSNPYLQ